MLPIADIAEIRLQSNKGQDRGAGFILKRGNKYSGPKSLFRVSQAARPACRLRGLVRTAVLTLVGA